MPSNQSGLRDLHSALRTEKIGSAEGAQVAFVLVRMQYGKDDVACSLHAAPHGFSSAGLQTTDFLSYLGFGRYRCAFVPDSECFSRWVTESFDVFGFAGAFARSFGQILDAEKRLSACGFILDQPEGWGYFSGKPSGRGGRGAKPFGGSDGHTASESEDIGASEDEAFQFALSYVRGGRDTGWTFHYRAKHLPMSTEVESAFRFLGLRTFQQCPFFDFEPCYWRFQPSEVRDDSPFHSNAGVVRAAFAAHDSQFSSGIESLAETESLVNSFGLSFMPKMAPARSIHGSSDLSPRLSDKATGTETGDFTYDVAISFAGTERVTAKRLAEALRKRGFRPFYDEFYPEQLWGKELPVFFDEIFRRKSRYCVILISEEYCTRMYPNRERQSAVARALEERGSEYILPIRVDDSELPGLPPTIGYMSLSEHTIEEITEILVRKLTTR